ncbi:uncharacterized protein LOC130724838 [Lotus japonicus]|uniref:uncharacterized protein LOC130724838 n=1 Tax=Lotus japonicus TaxID=34305 RepID=UPI00258BA6FF|nr:uncharacterized protein LOC130724838 [Lotus japonicus]
MKILSYNTRGLGSRTKWRFIRELILKEKVDMVSFQETKLDIIDKPLCNFIWGDSSFEWAFTPAVNRGRDLLCIWQQGAFVLENCHRGSSFISLRGVWGENSLSCVITNIYSPCSLKEKRIQWSEVVALRSTSPLLAWCVVGDFNSVRPLAERRGVSTSSYASRRDIKEFNLFIDAMQLCDIPLAGRRFIWVRPNGRAMSRLDRALVSVDWLEDWPNCFQQVMSRDISDHCPVVIKRSDVNWGPKPFRFL